MRGLALNPELPKEKYYIVIKWVHSNPLYIKWYLKLIVYKKNGGISENNNLIN